MGYYLIEQPKILTAQEFITQVSLAAVMKFQTMHTVELKPQIRISWGDKKVTISAGETEIFTFEELGF